MQHSRVAVKTYRPVFFIAVLRVHGGVARIADTIAGPRLFSENAEN
jgi:hypothetical protein